MNPDRERDREIERGREREITQNMNCTNELKGLTKAALV